MSIFCPLLSNLFIKKEGIKIEPDTAIVHLTNHCNLRCKTCYLPQAKTELDLSGWIKSLNILAHNEIKSVILIGGEPLSSPIFTDVMVYASNLFKNVEVQSVGYNERLPYLTPNNKFIIEPIGKFVDKIEKEKINLNGYRCISFNLTTKKSQFSQITGVFSHKPKNKLFKITTRKGKSIIVTEDHSVFTLKDKTITPIRASSLKKGDKIYTLNKIPLLPRVKELNLLNLFEDATIINVREWVKELKKRYGFKQIYNIFNKSYSYDFCKCNYNFINLRIFKKLLELDRRQLPLINKKYNFKIKSINSKSSLPIILKLSTHFCKLIGYHLSEGHISHRENGINISVYNKEIKKDLIDTLRKLNLNFKDYTKKNGQIRIANSTLTDLFLKIGCGKKAKEKRVPSFIFQLKKEMIVSFISTFINGDGTVHNKGVSLISKSKDLISDLILLFNYLGIENLCMEKVRNTVIRTKKFGGYKYYGDRIYVVNLPSGPNKDYFRKFKLIPSKQKNLNFNYKMRNYFTISPKGKNTLRKTRLKIFNGSINKFGDLIKIKPFKISLWERKDKGAAEPNKFFHYLDLLNINHLEFTEKYLDFDYMNNPDTDLRLEKIDKIEEVKNYSKKIYDLEVKGEQTENFLCGFGGICAHNTNGTVMPPTLIETIVNRNIKNINFFVSIDDIKNGKNYEEDIIRGEGVLKQAILFIKKLKLYDINVGIRSTLLQDNNYFGLTKLAKSLKVPIVFVRFIPIGRGKQLNAPSKERLKEVYDFIKFQEHATLFDCPYYIYNEKLFRKFKDTFLHRGICPFLAGRRIVLDTEANVYGCQMLMQYPFGNLFKHRFSDIITNKDEFITKTFQGINEQCNGCRVYSFCKGGCFIYTLNQMGGDPYCVVGG